MRFYFVELKNCFTFASSKKQAGVAQLVERQPSKLNVASSNLVFRSAKEILDIIKDFLSYIRRYKLRLYMGFTVIC